MTNENKWAACQSTQSGIAFKISQLMIANVKDAFKTFDAVSISKYVKITSINFAEEEKV